MHPLRQSLSWAVLTVFIVFFFSNGLHFQPSSILQVFGSTHGIDFSQYITLRTLTDQHFPIHVRNKRVILVGDIHGMDDAFHSLLWKLSYDPGSDVLLHCGDIIAKGTFSGSIAVLKYMTSNNITGVRGNHDQKVIEWRGWLNWVRRRSDGRQWLNELHQEWDKADADGVDLEAWISKETKEHASKWWKKIPKGWKMFGEHYRVARMITDEEYQYLLSLPLTLFVPSAHTYIAHAGLLPSDPHRSPSNPRQPLAHIPTLPSSYGDSYTKWDKTTVLRRLQGLALLKDVPQNTDPWVILNMRGVLRDNSVTRTQGGTPWSDSWNADMSRCAGFDTDISSWHDVGKDASLPCLPSMIVYGHAASRGLDIKRWSVGLDTGCVYGRRLTALVLGSSNPHIQEDNDEADDFLSRSKTTLPYGDDATAQIVSVKCHSK